MIQELPMEKMPDWLRTLDPSKPSFYLEDILNDSVYYPACGFDGSPVRFFCGNSYSFVYADYLFSPSELEAVIKEKPFKGYTVLCSKDIPIHLLKGVSPQEPNAETIDELYPEARKFAHYPHYARWFIFERDSRFPEEHGPKRFSLLFIGAEGVAVFRELYARSSSTMKMLIVKRPGGGFGCNWTRFLDRESILAQTILSHPDIAPDYFYACATGGFSLETKWPEYQDLVHTFPASREDDLEGYLFKLTDGDLIAKKKEWLQNYEYIQDARAEYACGPVGDEMSDEEREILGEVLSEMR